MKIIYEQGDIVFNKNNNNYGTVIADFYKDSVRILETSIVVRQEAIKALERQIPKKPDFEGDGYDDNGNLIYDTWYCPCCHKDYEVDYDDYNYCPYCGQALDWSEK